MNKERQETVEKIISWALDKKAEDVKHIDVEGKTDFTDSIIICHGTADLHVRAIADNIITMAKSENIQILSSEGKNNATWILIDMGDIIVHVFNEETRDFYKIEDLYKLSPKNRKKETENVEG
ncbi:MAG: ribosome silencing factor [Candidatus Cloacimonas sp. 4484_143]|nr:MAG: ribosome silencing factor [Candidatus Cloacimonas sp. 4484_143]RLC51477.1 MAG: ribosome silencing factor [Candidatus Cloacimonadota bacterium]RLC51483.1 MAG: ribosome silencing factor [Candidatus Cloacimonadota bacterium]